ncbi:transcription elongation factor GreA [Phreatobacter aquaticus]|uniref:Transcription elongation factor GreA n=1 Tax=Phreatobacter aquaticus TaxID=2570229 RepID=A0A4D7QGM9_9HYPH|nr:transcription elongation factor GreA [Phreatobacter aquaticus]QCK84567.1 transcription elongation factor GreA [Phreatobacter aquaticus]
MSVAFTKESDRDGTEPDLPERAISPHPNLVTEAGLALLDEAVAKARAESDAAQASGEVRAYNVALARAERDLRYYLARRASAQLMPLPVGSGKVQFGSRVTFDRDDGRRQTFRIVGEDEANPSSGSVSHVSPVARALMGKVVGDTAPVAGQDVEIVAIDPA